MPPSLPLLTAAQADLLSCHVCTRLTPAAADHQHRCSRCGAPLHLRKPNSIQRSWALLIAGMLLYLPANVFPIMKIVSFGSVQTNTILSGVVHLWEEGMYPLALIVFVASVMVPVLKIIILIYLLLSVQFGWSTGARQRTVLYRLTEAVGRWSMVDVFVVALLAALVHIGTVATIIPGPAALAFAAVVIVTMLAAMAFDPRLIWDALPGNNAQ
jgi:paraquat-inducible protein A